MYATNVAAAPVRIEFEREAATLGSSARRGSRRGSTIAVLMNHSGFAASASRAAKPFAKLPIASPIEQREQVRRAFAELQAPAQAAVAITVAAVDRRVDDREVQLVARDPREPREHEQHGEAEHEAPHVRAAGNTRRARTARRTRRTRTATTRADATRRSPRPPGANSFDHANALDERPSTPTAACAASSRRGRRRRERREPGGVQREPDPDGPPVLGREHAARPAPVRAHRSCRSRPP